ncbi:SH3 domain-containing protein [Anaerolineales bacterium HSG25]|nr:SH3 domain-containing protein [Anaerolineales bacterium HSG25]
MSQKQRTIILILFIFILTACNSMQTSGETRPTPAITRLDQDVVATAQAEATAQLQSDEAVMVADALEPESTKATTTDDESAETDDTTRSVSADSSDDMSDANQTDMAVDDTESIMVEVIATGLHIRSGPGLDYPTVGTAIQGDQFEVLGIDAGRFWLNIKTDEGTAWLSSRADYSQLQNGSKDDLPIVVPETKPAEQSSRDTTPERTEQTTLSQTTDQLLVLNHSGGELYRVALDGTGLTKIAGLEANPTTFHGGVIDPVLSPDGRQIAFTRWDGAENGALYSVKVDGSDERLILGDIRQPKSPTWSPDGSQIVISFQHGGVVNPDEECRYFDEDDGINLPKNIIITSRGQRDNGFMICFIRIEDAPWALRLVDVVTGEFSDLPTERYSFSPTWHPQQAWQIIYQGEKGLVQFDLHQQSQTMLTTDHRDGSPVFSPDGTKLAMTYRQHDHWEVYTLDLTTGERQRLTKPPILADPQYNSSAPTWSPDGSQIAFLTDRTGSWEVWVMNVDGSDAHPLFTPEVQAELNLRYDGMKERLLSWSNMAQGL